ncbi:MAG: hypothetical protein JJU41_07550 [Bacteroidetes bacterium]|nr:hypothetical protein [Bacteroidota bacterium]MCH8523166.1 hypothetical protein [Balneolales bacterium]
MKKKTLTLFVALFVVACGGSQDGAPSVDLSSMSHQERVEYHISVSEHQQAFDYIQANMIPEPLRTELLLATHMTFAWEMTHGEIADQRTRMPAALRHLRRVLELEPGNPQALEQIALIEGIYQSLGRPIPEGVAEDRVML